MSRKHVKILQPNAGKTVDLRGNVFGIVHPHDSTLQVLVYSRDQKWYFQAKPNRLTGFFKVNVQFGDEVSPSGAEYQVVAVIPDNPEHTDRTDQIPEGTKSNTVRVVRR